jgi:hypothetical protein
MAGDRFAVEAVFSAIFKIIHPEEFPTLEIPRAARQTNLNPKVVC